MGTDGFKPHNDYFTYNTAEQLRERDPLLNKYLVDTVAFSVAGAAVGLGVGVFLKNPRIWSYFFAGVGAQTAYSRGPVKFKWFQCCNSNKQC